MSALGRFLSRALGALFLALIGLYRLILAPFLGGRCRFEPSCSVYAAECIRIYGPLSGAWRAIRRVGKCHPFHPGGYDPPVRES